MQDAAGLLFRLRGLALRPLCPNLLADLADFCRHQPDAVGSFFVFAGPAAVENELVFRQNDLVPDGFQRLRDTLYAVGGALGQLLQHCLQLPQQFVVRHDLPVQFAAVGCDTLFFKIAGNIA